MTLATTDVWESTDAQAAWYELEPKEQRQHKVRHVLLPAEVPKKDVPSAGETTPSMCSSRQSPAMTSKESPVDQRLHRTAQKKSLRHRQRSMNPAVTESSGVESQRKILGQVLITDANEGFAVEDWYASPTHGIFTPAENVLFSYLIKEKADRVNVT